MEKSTTKTRRLCIGLLTFLLLELVSICLPQKIFAVSWEYLQGLRLKKTEKYFFTSMDCSFAVNIENVPPEKISAAINDLPQGASFVSLRKELYVPTSGDAESYGTKLIMTFRFSSAGAYQFRAVDVKVDTWYSRIPFESVYVYENPSTVQPKISITFSDSRFASTSRTLNMTVGQHLKFTLNIRYATQVYDLSWSLPENSLFQEIESYDITRQAVNNDEFNPNSVPVATFDWQPLVEGEYLLPEFNMSAMSFGGVRRNAIVPSYKIIVGPATVKESPKDSDGTGIYINAFADVESKTENVQKTKKEIDSIENLLELHESERWSIPIFSSARKERLAIEDEAGLDSSTWEPSIPLLIVIWSVAFVLILLTVILFIIHKIPGAATCLAVGVIFVGLGVFYTKWSLQKNALYTGGDLAQIPEYGSGAGVSLPKGTMVQILKETNQWSYIRSNDTYGWVLNDKLLEIN